MMFPKIELRNLYKYFKIFLELIKNITINGLRWNYSKTTFMKTLQINRLIKAGINI